jgi:hypothetical protein
LIIVKTENSNVVSLARRFLLGWSMIISPAAAWLIGKAAIVSVSVRTQLCDQLCDRDKVDV